MLNDVKNQPVRVMFANEDRFAAWWLHSCTIIMEVCEVSDI